MKIKTIVTYEEIQNLKKFKTIINFGLRLLPNVYSSDELFNIAKFKIAYQELLINGFYQQPLFDETYKLGLTIIKR